jgi:uncharacterized membrane protein
MRTAPQIIFSLCLSLAGCASQDGGQEQSADPVHSSGARCPSSSELTYQSFAEDFFANYCLECHSSELSGAERNKAPSAYNFNTLKDVAEHLEEIDSVAAHGPDRQNDEMPPSAASASPSDEERAQLGQWLACGAP